MRGVEEVKAPHPGLSYEKLLLFGVPALAVVLLLILPFDFRAMGSSPRLAAILGRLQAGAVKLYLVPLSRRPLLTFCVLALCACAPGLYGLLAKRFKSKSWEHVGLLYVPGASLLASALVFVLCRRLGVMDGQGRLFWTGVLYCYLGFALPTAAAGVLSLRRGAFTIRDIARNPDAYDIEDLSGAAKSKDVPGLLIQSESWPSRDAMAMRGRVCIGRFHEEKRNTNLWVAPEIARLNQSLVVAPPGSGKTYSIALPWTRELPLQGQSVFVWDVKGNMRHKLEHFFHEHRLTLYYFDPSEPAHSLHWNPFSEIRLDDPLELSGARDQIAEAIFGEVSASKYAYWDLKDLRTLKAGIDAILRAHMMKSAVPGDEVAVARPEPCLKDLHELFLRKQTVAAAIQDLRRLAERSEHEHVLPMMTAIADLEHLLDEEDLNFSDKIQGVRNKVEPFGHPATAKVMDGSYVQAPGGGRLPFSLVRITEHPSAFICSTPLKLGHLGSSLASITVRMLQHVMALRFSHHRPDCRLFMILDEFSKLKLSYAQTEQFISTSREAGCVSVIILQDVSQVPQDIRPAILSNCKDRYFLRGAGPATADWYSAALGSRRRLQASLSDSRTEGTRQQSGGLSASVSEQWVPVLRPREIATTGGLKYGAWVVLDGYSHKPCLVNLERPED